MTYLLELLGGVSLSTVILVLAACIFIYKQVKKVYKAIIDDHDKRQEKEESLDGLKADIKAIKANQETFEIVLNEVKQKQEQISKKQEEIESTNREHRKNRIMDTLLQYYRFYTNKNSNPQLAWTRMEKDTFDRLFHDYESLDGNGYMHSEVQPAMNKLHIIEMDKIDEIISLMESRKG